MSEITATRKSEVKELSVVGKSVIKIDALDKVTGRTHYCSDEAVGVPGMLYGKVLMSPHAHANIKNIDISKAVNLKGVRIVLTGKDAPKHRDGILIDDRHVLCNERVRYVGDIIAAIAAESIEIAEEAADLIKVDYEVLPAIFDAEEAMKPDCKVILHPELAKYNRPAYAYMGNDLPGPNVHTHHKIRRGNVEKGFQESDLIIENRFQNDRIIHCQMEPFNSICYPEADGSLTLWTSGRNAITLQNMTREFNLTRSQLRVRTSYLGGMFGLKARTARFSILLALKTGRPIKTVYTREECFVDGTNRLPKIIYVKDGVKKDGTLMAREIKVIVNTGGYTDYAPLTIRNGAFHASQYRIPHYKWDAYGVYTNEPSCGPLRGFGNAEALWATEQQMDIAARKLGIDPLEYRLKNTIDEGEIDVRGQTVHCIGAKECLKKAAQWIGWDKPLAQPTEKHIKIGRGIGLGNKYSLGDTASSAMIKVNLDGTIELYHGGDDCGQGLNTAMAQIAAEEFNTSMDKIKVIFGDSARTPYDYGSASSRSTLYIGKAVMLACRDAKKRVFELSAKKLNTTPDNLDIKDGKVFFIDNPEKVMDISELALGKSPNVTGLVKWATTCLEEGAGIYGSATFWGHADQEDPETGQGEHLSMSVGYGGQAVEVAVDTETGVVKVLRVCSAFDNGKSINPKMCEAQIEGGAALGIGSALYEGFIFDDKGKLLNPNFHDYKISTMVNVPSGENNKSGMVEYPHMEGPYGAKGVGEASMTPTAPAIANAIYDATGVRLYHLPMTPERVLKALKENKK